MVVYSLFNSVVLDLLLRHLLLVAGAAVVTVCIYYYVQRDDGGQTTEDTEDTTVPEDPVYEQTTEPALVRHTEVVQDQMMEAEAEAEEKIQELVVPKIQLEDRVKELVVPRIQLDDRVKELEELLCEAHKSYDLKSKVILAKAEKKHQKDVKTITQLKKQNSDLTERVEALRETLKKTKNRLFESNIIFDDMFNEQDQEEHLILQSVNQEMQYTIVQMEVERSEKLIQIENQKNKMKDLGNLVFDMNIEIDHLTNEQKRAREAYGILRAENMKMKKTITQLEEENSEMKKTITQQQEENSEMKKTITQQQEENNEMKKTITQLEDNSEMKKTITQQEENNEMKKTITQQEENNEMKKTITQLEEENSEMKKNITQLEEENSEMKMTLIPKEQLLKKQEQPAGAIERSTGSTSKLSDENVKITESRETPSERMKKRRMKKLINGEKKKERVQR
ncbi:golgin subfamily A member 6-like protein 25 [Tachysurus vachellii]|uniref:golgin subfamily A member 6-like protein 25 n=1 Tax=Tachysurus vachellii TaxID=175792 RepID=UPI00296AD8B8|nr:golgin subfamily A member 6-like protein 25 [Tachysurus vachellii]